MKYYFIAGEASGDMHAANCMRELVKLDPFAEFSFTGGEQMEAVSNKKPSIHIKNMAFMGFVDVLKNIGTIRKNFNAVKKDILQFKPDLLVLVDYPGFNLRMAKWAHRHGIKTDYYISPTVWAWKESRVEIIRRFTNRLFVILPFEEDFYKKHNHKVYFVGHPLIDAIEQKRLRFKSREVFMKENNLPEKPMIAVLPGSRAQEIERMMEIMMDVTKFFPSYQFVVAGSNNLARSYYEPLKNKDVCVVFDQTYELMTYASAGIIKSGTSTLESALLGLPQVVCYKGGGLSFKIAKALVDVKFIALPNLIMDAPVVKELIQNDLTAANIKAELELILDRRPYREKILSDYEKVREKLGGTGASRRLAEQLFSDASRKN